MKPIENINKMIAEYYQSGNNYAEISEAVQLNKHKMDILRDVICQHLDLDVDKFANSNRHQKYAKGRAIFSYVLYQHYDFKPNEIGKIINRDRSLTYWAWRKINT
jgi:chromosomal replication initiation ATPase DnaA